VKLRTLLVVDAAVFVVSAITFAALVPSNFDSRDPSPVYTVAWSLAIASLVVLVVGALLALVRRFVKPS
jgi:peptidoglycan/LPS O-acetylase OafA/YrhL